MDDRPSDRELAAPAEKPASNSRRRLLLLAIPILIVVDLIAFAVVPPFPPGQPGLECQFPVCFINGNFEFPAPSTVFGQAPEPGQIVTFAVGISSTLFTMWIIGGALLVAAFFLGRLRKDVPGRIQNFSEWTFESIRNFGLSIGGPQAAPYIPIFAAFFLLILLCNWAGLVPPIGKVEFLRAPTSDVNITIGLALTAFVIFEVEGFQARRAWLPGQVLSVLRIQERHRRRLHRHVRRPDRADARVRQANHALDATFREHLRR